MYQQTTLANGLRVVSEKFTTVSSVSVGAFVNAGARNETGNNNGVAHFLEHMAFKGTTRRSALDIAVEVENVGGYMNAYTGHETTVYYLKVMQQHMPLAVDILGDILQHSTFVADEVERERGVILQEIGQTLDTPDDMVFEHLQNKLYPNQPMGRSILGTHSSVSAMKKTDFQQFVHTFYTAPNMVLAASGNVEHEAFVAEVEKAFALLSAAPATKPETAVYVGGTHIETKNDLEQVHVAAAWPAITYFDNDYYAAHLWNTVLSGGMSSRLFQEIREKRGLVYSVFSFVNTYTDTGDFGVYAGTSAKNVAELMQVMAAELAKASTHISEEELERAKAQLLASLVMSQESTDARMTKIARNLMLYNRAIPVEETRQKIAATTVADCLRAGQRMIAGQRSLSVLGPVDNTAAAML